MNSIPNMENRFMFFYVPIRQYDNVSITCHISILYHCIIILMLCSTCNKLRYYEWLV